MLSPVSLADLCDLSFLMPHIVRRRPSVIQAWTGKAQEHFEETFADGDGFTRWLRFDRLVQEVASPSYSVVLCWKWVTITLFGTPSI
jgi:hypothetical protein